MTWSPPKPLWREAPDARHVLSRRGFCSDVDIDTIADDAARARQAIVQAARNRMDMLRAAAPRGTYEHAFLRRDPDGFDAVDLALLDRLTWHYRDRLPVWARPKLNPADPIVQEARNGS